MKETIFLKVGLIMVASLLSFFACCPPAAFAGPGKNPLGRSLQAVAVTTGDWQDFTGTLQSYERTRPDRPWTAVGERVPVVVGRNGLGWGKGLHGPAGPEGPVKREGDGKAPAGAFFLGDAFGYASPEEAAGIRLPYRQATPRLLCIDDASSAHYNRIVDAERTACDWKSFEDLRRRDDQYRWGIVVGHNADPVVPGGGSCIFMHLWDRPDTGTSGCTSMSPEAMTRLLHWLDPAARPVLIQLPGAVYEAYRREWGLPRMAP